MAKAADRPEHAAAPRDFFYRSADGLRLHAREYGERTQPYLPVVCLPGLTRSARDFDDLARFLSNHRHRPRRVLAFDYRGRGGSEWDRDLRNYNPVTEMGDILDGMTAAGVGRAIVVGTSRGGIIAMMMAIARPSVLAGVVLNDIGPQVEPIGLARIKTYVGRTPQPDDWNDAVRILKRLNGGQFTGLSDVQWMDFARMTWREEDGFPVSDYDPAIGRTFDGVEFDSAVPSLWNEFGALAHLPVLSIRGENSDLLSDDTLTGMAAVHPQFETITVPGQGHAPLLRGGPILQRISSFITAAEGSGPPVEAVIPRTPTDFSLDGSRNAGDPDAI